MSDPEPKPLSEEEEWVRRFFWHRGLLGSKLEDAQKQVMELVSESGQSSDHRAVRIAAIAVLETLNALPHLRERLISKARKMGIPEADTEDLPHTILEKAWTNKSLFHFLGGWPDHTDQPLESRLQETQQRLSGWLRNERIDHIRKTNAYSLDSLMEAGFVPERTLSGASISDLWNADQRKLLLNIDITRFIEAIEPESDEELDFQILWAHAVEKRSRKQIAEEFGFTQEKVRAAESRAGKRLVQWLEGDSGA